MRTKEATGILKSIGWNVYRDEGDRCAQFNLSDRVVDIIYDVQELLHSQKFRIILSMSTEVFSTTYKKIRKKDKKYSPLIVAWNWEGIYAPEIKEEHIQQASREAINWAKKQNLHQALLEHAALPTSAAGTAPVLHLSSLALLGDIEKLKFYQSSFEAGDRLGFAPYITKDFIDRAVELAEQYLAKK